MATAVHYRIYYLTKDHILFKPIASESTPNKLSTLLELESEIGALP